MIYLSLLILMLIWAVVQTHDGPPLVIVLFSALLLFLGLLSDSSPLRVLALRLNIESGPMQWLKLLGYGNSYVISSSHLHAPP